MPRLKIQRWFYLFVCLSSFAGCGNRDQQAERFSDLENVFLDYQVQAREGDDNLSVLLQFREYDEEGFALTLPEEASVQLDGRELEADSTGMTGTYYEAYFPTLEFRGDHRVTLNHSGEKEEVPFQFFPLQITNSLPDTISPGGMDIELDAPGGAIVRILLIDTVFENEGINRIDSLRDGRISLSAEDLAGLAPGPVQMELILEQEKALETRHTAGGRLTLSYSIRREFILSR